MSPEGQTGSDVVEATLALAADAAVDLALERVQLGLVRVQLVLELGDAQAQPAVLADERGHLLRELHQPRGSMRFVPDVLEAERVEHEVERLALMIGDTVAAWVHGAPPWCDGMPQDQIGSDQASEASRGPVSAHQQRVPLCAIRNYVYLNGARRREAGPMDWLIEERLAGLSEGREARHRPGSLRRAAG